MKLRDKKTGEIVEAITGDTCEVGGVQLRSLRRNPQIVCYYNSLAELNEEWEDYEEEPKEYWYIDDAGVIQIDQVLSSEINMRKSIGNYFESREEAEQAVEKLKAWKRLKDKGFRFKGYTDDSGDLFSCQVIRCSFDDFGKESRKDLDICFGGEE